MSTGLPSFSFDLQPVFETRSHTRKIGGFWRRFLALLIDWLVLLVVGAGLGAALFDEFSRMGQWGRLVGFCIALVYFAFYDSSIGEGQTFGKQWMKLRVTDAQGNTISFGKSLVRYTIFAAPIFLYELSLPSMPMMEAIVILLFTVVFGIGGSTFYLLIFNRTTGQGLHDLAVGSFVLKAEDAGPVETRSIWKMHWAVVGLICVLAIIAGVLSNQQTDSASITDSPERVRDSRLVLQINGVHQVYAEDSISYDLSSGQTKRSLVIYIHWSGNDGDQADFSDKAARVIVQNPKNLQNYDLLKIVLTRGFDLGFASGSLSWSAEHTPAEWRQRVLPAAPAQSPTSTQKLTKGQAKRAIQ